MRISDWSSDVCSSDLKAGKIGANLVTAIFVVTHNRIAAGSQVYAYLVGASGAQLGAQQAVATIAFLQRNDGVGDLALRVHLDPTLAGSRQPLQQRLAQMLLVIDPVAHHQGLIMLAPAPLAHHVVQPQ